MSPHPRCPYCGWEVRDEQERANVRRTIGSFLTTTQIEEIAGDLVDGGDVAALHARCLVALMAGAA